MLALRAWLIPQIIPEGPFVLSDGRAASCEWVAAEIDPRTYTTEPIGDGPAPPPLIVSSVLLSLEVEGTDIRGDYARDWQRLHEAVQQWCMWRMSVIDCYSSRVDLANPVVDEPRECIVYPSWPPPIADSAIPGGFGLEPAHDPFHSSTTAKHVACAIGWWLRSLRTMDTFERAKAAWFAIEAIAQGPIPGRHGKVTKSIVETLARVAVLENEARELYKVRSQLVHGQTVRDTSNAEKIGNHSLVVMGHALQLIKLELGWPLDKPPFVNAQGGCHAGSFACHGEFTAKTPTAYKEPVLMAVTPVLVPRSMIPRLRDASPPTDGLDPTPT